MSKLRDKPKKDLKNIQKKLAKAEKGSTFAPATAKTFTETLKGDSSRKK